MRIRHALAVAATLTALAPPLPAGESVETAPRRGLWRFERSFEYADGRAPGEPVTAESCVDPSAAAEEQIAMFRRMGCAVERRRVGPAEFGTAVTCDRPGLPRGRSSSVQTVESASAYEIRIVNEGEMAMPVVRERLVARRIGDC